MAGLLLLLIIGCMSCSLGSSESLRSIAERVNSIHTSWKAETDIPGDTTKWSLRRRLGALRGSRDILPVKEDGQAPHLLALTEIPKEFDARVRWPYCPSIRHIRDQGNCGSCWAVATASVLSDRLCIATKGAFTDYLSDDQMLGCCHKCGFGCDGGYPEVAWLYLQNHGIVTGGDYNSSQGCQPYSLRACEHHTQGNLPPCASLNDEKAPNCQKKCTNPKYNKLFLQDHHRSQEGYKLKRDVREIQKEILINGPVEATFNVFSDFATYKSGVYQYKTGSILGGHAVKVIGWGVENGLDYWLVSNSWNTHWGEEGLFKISRGVNECGFEEDMTAAKPLL